MFRSFWYLGNDGCLATNDTMYNMPCHLPLLQVNALKAPLTKAFFQNYWWSHNWQGPYNVNMVVAIFLLMYMTSISLPFAVQLQEFSTYLLRKRDITSRCPFSLHDAKKISYVLFCDNYTALKVYPYIHIFPLAQSVHLLFEHNESPYNRKYIWTPCPTCALYKSRMNGNFT